MAGMSAYLEGKVLEHTLDIASYTAPSAVYVGLYTAPPTDAGGGTEVSGGSYARQEVTFSRADNVAENDAQIEFPMATASWGTVVAAGVFDAPSGGNLLYWNDLASVREVGNGSEFFIEPGNLTVTMD